MKFFTILALFSFTASGHAAAAKPCKLVDTIGWGENQAFFEDALGYPYWNAIPAMGSRLGVFGLKYILGFDEQTRMLSALSLADLSVSTYKVDIPFIGINSKVVRGSEIILVGNQDVPHGAEAVLAKYSFNEATRKFELKIRRTLVDQNLGRLWISGEAKMLVGSQTDNIIVYGKIGK